MESAIGHILGQGLLGAIVVVLGFAYWQLQNRHKQDVERLQGQYKQAMEDRVADAKKVTETVLAVNEKWAQTIDAHRQAIDRFTATAQVHPPRPGAGGYS